MKIRGRVLVLAVSMAVVAFAVVGGFMSNAIARQDTISTAHLEDVVSLILNTSRRRERRQSDAARCTASRTVSTGQRVLDAAQ